MMSHDTICVYIMGKFQNRSHCHTCVKIMICPLCVKNILVMPEIVQVSLARPIKSEPIFYELHPYCI